MCGTNVPNLPRPDAVAHMSRRGFLRAATTATVAAGASMALKPWGTPAHAATCTGTVPVDRRSMQLFSLNNQSMNDVDTCFARLVEIGYQISEEAGYGNAGTPEEFKAALDRAGYASSSTHKNIPDPFDEAAFRQIIADAQTIGISRIVEPLPQWALPFLVVGSVAPGSGLGVGPPRAQLEQFAETLNAAGAISREELGTSVGYHNHTELFMPVLDGGVLDGTVGMDVLAEATDPDLVHFEMDIYWVHAAGQDPVEYIQKYPGRIQQLHVKDMAEDGSITAPGTGIIDFNRVFAAASTHQDIREYIIEQDNASENEGGDMTAAELGWDLLDNARWEYDLDACTAAAGGGAPAPAPLPDPTAQPDPAPGTGVAASHAERDLPVTGGGLAGVGALALGSVLALRNRRTD